MVATGPWTVAALLPRDRRGARWSWRPSNRSWLPHSPSAHPLIRVHSASLLDPAIATAGAC
eukprot:9500574-Pyramimonas_sp.AAC.1